MERQDIINSILSKYSPELINTFFENLKKNPLNEYYAKRILWYYFLHERLATKIKGINFFDFYENFSTKYIFHPMIQNIITTQNYDDTPHDIFRIYRVCYSSVSVFKISNAINIIEQFPQIKTIIDPCAGWGGRMLGSILSGKKYIGFDTNLNLRDAYEKILRHFPNHNARIKFCDALDIDYTKYRYDCIFTSPPYYNIELYSYCGKRSKTEWNNWYRTLFTKLFDSLKRKGIMVLSINAEIYEFFKTIFGECTFSIPLKITYSRNAATPYTELVYIWQKD